jgi:uncharacterized protein (DUF305 family)
MVWVRRRAAGVAASAAILGLGLVAIVAGVAGCSGGDDGDDAGNGDDGEEVRTVQPGAPGEPTEELSDEEADAVTPPEHSPADTAFMQDMILHHQQALDMAALVEDRTERDDLPMLAERITVAQESEIELIEEWLSDRDEEVPDTDVDADHGEHADMPGMATEAQLEALEDARGAAFDRMFLELMIAHHRGAVTMVEELYADGGGLEPAADRLARDVEADQNAEITRMEELLATLP